MLFFLLSAFLSAREHASMAKLNRINVFKYISYTSVFYSSLFVQETLLIV